MTKSPIQAKTTPSIDEELASLIDDRRLIISNSESLIIGIGFYDPYKQDRISRRKKDTRQSLKRLWLLTNPTLTSDNFDHWLSEKIKQTS